MRGFLRTHEGRVPGEWIDLNGHMNVKWYVELFDKGTFALLDKIGIDRDSIEAGLPTVVAGRLYITFRKELQQDDPWELWTGLSAIKPSALTITHRLVSGDRICASCDILGSVILPHMRSAGALTRDMLERAQAHLVRGLKDFYS